MNTQHLLSHDDVAGFTIPSALADFPSVPRKGVLLTLEQEQSFGFRMLIHSLSLISALACDAEIVSNMIDDVEAAFAKGNKADKAVSLVQSGGVWFRSGSLPSDAFAAHAEKQIQEVRVALQSLQTVDYSGRDLFYVNAITELRGALGKLLPYDLILSKATNSFRNRYASLNSACRELITFVSDEMKISKPASHNVCSGFLISNKLPAICLAANRHFQSSMTTSAKRDFRSGVVERQNKIAELANMSDIPVSELLNSWSTFAIESLRMDRMAGTFAQMNSGLVEKTAAQYHFANDFDQVRSAAYQGLTRAMNLYAPERGLKFSTYASNWIKQIVLRDLIKQEMVRLPEGAHAMIMRVRAVYADAPNASDEYVCKTANVSNRDLKNFMPYIKGNSALSMDGTSKEDEGADLHTLIADQNNDFAKDIEDESTALYLDQILKGALTKNEHIVLRHRLELGDSNFMTNLELADMLEMSPQNVNRMEKSAQQKLACIPEISEIWAAMKDCG
tara:strand:+ start:14897 stop:16414 length:1518 start_codon:yes stop_codon:yes gene_type:complete